MNPSAAALVPMQVNDWLLFASGQDHWVRAVDIGERAGKAAPRHTRGIAKRAIEDGGLTVARPTSSGPSNSGRATSAVPAEVPFVRIEKLLIPKGNGAMQEVDEYYLNEAGALLLVTRLRTPAAIQLTRTIVQVFVLARQGRLNVPAAATSHAVNDIQAPRKIARRKREKGQDLNGRQGNVFSLRITDETRQRLESLQTRLGGPPGLGPWLVWRAEGAGTTALPEAQAPAALPEPPRPALPAAAPVLPAASAPDLTALVTQIATLTTLVMRQQEQIADLTSRGAGPKPAQREEPQPPPPRARPLPPDAPSPREQKLEDLRGALKNGLGWKAPAITWALAALDAKIDALSLQELVKEAIELDRARGRHAPADGVTPRPGPATPNTPSAPAEADEAEQPAPELDPFRFDPDQGPGAPPSTEHGRKFVALLEDPATFALLHRSARTACIRAGRLLARHCDNEGRVAMSQDTISDRAPMAAPTVPRTLRRLVAAGILELSRASKPGVSTVYRLLLERKPQPMPPSGAAAAPSKEPPTAPTAAERPRVMKPAAGMTRPMTPLEEKFALARELMLLGASQLAAAKGVGISQRRLRQALAELKPEEWPLLPASLTNYVPKRALPKLKREVMRATLKNHGYDRHDVTRAINALGSRIDQLPLDEALREAIKYLSPAA